MCLAGDVMTGRGVDQILAHPGDPRLWEPYVRDARTYVRLAEQRNGPVPRPVPPRWPWGEVLPLLDRLAPQVWLVNLETSVTGSDQVDRTKGVHYRMSPDNVACLAAAAPVVCALANNHVGDFGRPGLAQTLQVLRDIPGLQVTGAGLDLATAQRPAVVPTAHGRVLIFSCGDTSSGIPPRWVAGAHRPGVDLLPDLSDATADMLTQRVGEHRRAGDLIVLSIHWGSNWGYEVPPAHCRFARRLIDGGVDLVHGHSSHHPRPVEVYRGKLILYGSGDLINDYEGIGGYESYRDDLRLVYAATLAPGSGQVQQLHLWPWQARRLRLHPAADDDRRWWGTILDRASRPYGVRVQSSSDGPLHVMV